MDESLIEKQNGNFAKPVLYEVCRAGIKEAWLAGSLSFASGLCVLAAKDNVPAKCVGLNLKQ